jgi:uncharacterized membrane protein
MKNTTMANIVLVLSAVATALIAGLFYAYSCSVNPGLGRLPDTQYIAAMQSINRAILNPLFFASFMGTLILLPISAYQQYSQPVPLRFWLMLSATLIYAIGTFGVTMFGNVPLNNALDKFSLTGASAEDISNARKSFELPWNRLHTIRTIASVASLILVILACITKADKPN